MASVEHAGAIRRRPGDQQWTQHAQRLNTICPYFTMFPLEFPLDVLRGGRPGQWVLDPFCGRGTTLFAARLLGLGSVGIDTNPVAAAIAQAKVQAVRRDRIEALAVDLVSNSYQPTDVPQGQFWETLYDPATLHDVCRLREQLYGRCDADASVLRAIILGILHGPLTKREPTYFSNQMPRTYATKPGAAVKYWTRRGLRPPQVPVLPTLLRRIDYSLSLVPPLRHKSVVLHGDARHQLPRLRRKFSWVITSPPYYGMYSYLPDQWIRNWFLGGPPTVDYEASSQISRGGLSVFTHGLAQVWRATAARCTPGATLAIRFGALPSAHVAPDDLLRKSLTDADSGWTIQTTRTAGHPTRQARQAAQFTDTGDYALEIDCVATLDS